MQSKKSYLIPIVIGILLIIISGFAFVGVKPASAQCGSQASSCKNCHEVQGKDPVNNDGTSWHQSHAFGDFCYICHGGNQQATDQDTAHTGLVAPLSDIKASCQSCHPNDLQARAQVYASALGVEIGSTTNVTTTVTPPPSDKTQPTETQPITIQESSILPNDPNLVDYVQHYNENALGQHPINWGNIILISMIAVMLVGGGSLVLQREGLVRVSFKDTKPVEGEFPADVVEMVPALARLKPAARKSLLRLLEKPDATAEVLTSIEKLTEDMSVSKKE